MFQRAIQQRANQPMLNRAARLRRNVLQRSSITRPAVCSAERFITVFLPTLALGTRWPPLCKCVMDTTSETSRFMHMQHTHKQRGCSYESDDVTIWLCYWSSLEKKWKIWWPIKSTKKSIKHIRESKHLVWSSEPFMGFVEKCCCLYFHYLIICSCGGHLTRIHSSDRRFYRKDPNMSRNVVCWWEVLFAYNFHRIGYANGINGNALFLENLKCAAFTVFVDSKELSFRYQNCGH